MDAELTMDSRTSDSVKSVPSSTDHRFSERSDVVFVIVGTIRYIVKNGSTSWRVEHEGRRHSRSSTVRGRDESRCNRDASFQASSVAIAFYVESKRGRGKR